MLTSSYPTGGTALFPCSVITLNISMRASIFHIFTYPYVSLLASDLLYHTLTVGPSPVPPTLLLLATLWPQSPRQKTPQIMRSSPQVGGLLQVWTTVPVTSKTQNKQKQYVLIHSPVPFLSFLWLVIFVDVHRFYRKRVALLGPCYLTPPVRLRLLFIAFSFSLGAGVYLVRYTFFDDSHYYHRSVIRRWMKGFLSESRPISYVHSSSLPFPTDTPPSAVHGSKAN